MTQAAYGAAFGDAVGVALLNPTANGSTALLANEVQNALIDNAEGSYKPGIALSQEPPHIPLQGEALLIPNAGGGPFGPAIDWAFSGGPGAYAQFVAPAQIGPLQITNAPNNFTLNTQHFGTQDTQVIGHGQLFTLIVGDSIASDNLGLLQIQGYSTVHVVVANSPGTNIINTAFGSFSDMVVSGSGHLSLNQIEVPAIIDIGVSLATGLIQTYEIDASNAPVLVMGLPNLQEGVSTLPGVTVLGGTSGNVLQGSLDFFGAGGTTVTFSNGSTGFSSASGPDQFTGGPGGADEIFGLGGSDVITLPNHLLRDFIVFGQEQGVQNIVQAITDGNDVAHLGFWGTGGSATPIPALFGGGNTGGTSTDMTAITGFQAGPNGDVLDFTLGAWNGNSVQVGLGFATGDLESPIGDQETPRL